MKKLLTLAVLLAPLYEANAWTGATPTATKPAATTAPKTSTWTSATTPTGTPKSSTGGPTIGAHRTPTATTGTSAPAAGGTGSTGGILGSLGGAAGAIGGITGALGGSMMPNLDLALNLSFQTIENNTKCYTKVNQPVHATDGSQVMIQNGNCTTTNVSSMGKAGDIYRFNVAGLKTLNAGNVDVFMAEIISVPAVDNDGNALKNALLISFAPQNPLGSTTIPGSQLKGRTVQVLIRTRDLTDALAATEGVQAGTDKILLEVWGRTYPSVRGTTDFTQLFSMVLDKSDIGRRLYAGVNPEGSAGLYFNVQDPKDASKRLIVGNVVNVTSVKP